MLLRTLSTAAYAVGVAALLSGCSQSASSPLVAQSQPQSLTQNGVLGARPTSGAAVRTPGWLSPEAKSGKGLLYVSDQFNQRIAIFSTKKSSSPEPVGQITDGISAPDGAFVDPKGTLYVCNFGAGTVTEYAKGKTKLSKTLTGAGSPKYVVAGTDGTVYVSNFNGSFNGDVLEYAKGKKTPTQTIPFSTFPAGLALDKSNNLYVAYNDSQQGDIEVLEFAPGSTNGTNLGIHIAFGYAGSMTIDKKGELLIADQEDAIVYVFPSGATKPSTTYSTTAAYAVALDAANKHLFISAPFAPAVSEITYPKGVPVQTYSNTLSAAFGVATSPDSAL
ncbi:MAG: SMP-30/gluconolactonase/LRE family protein [Candidatus Tumulicola sp.]